MKIPDVFQESSIVLPYILHEYLLKTWKPLKDKMLFHKRMYLRNLDSSTSIPCEIENESLKAGKDKTTPTMSIITAATVMTEKSNYRMLVKDGVTANAMCSTKLCSKSKTSNRVVSHGEGLVKTEFPLRHN
jgi:hypothetical protein